MDRMICPECEYSGDEKEFVVRYCPSDGDKCEGCEVDDTRFQCPNCLHDGPKHVRDTRDQWDTWAEWRGER